MSTLRVSGVVSDSIVDGPGLRLSVFAQGCPHRCAGCHNPETHGFEGGQERSVASILAELQRNPLLGGLTLSGGEPFSQAVACAELAAAAKALGKSVWCYTGYTLEELLARPGDDPAHALLAQLDALVDGPYIEARRSLQLRFRGSENQRILDVPASLAAGQAVPLNL